MPSRPGLRMNPSDRGVLIGKLADAIEKDRDNIALVESLDTGHPIRDTHNLDVMRTVATYRYFAGMPDKNEGTVIPVDTGFPELCATGSGGCGWPDCALEFSPDVYQLETGACTGCR